MQRNSTFALGTGLLGCLAAAWRAAAAVLRLRPGPGRQRPGLGAQRLRPGAVGRRLRPREPHGDLPRVPEHLSRLAGAPARTVLPHVAVDARSRRAFARRANDESTFWLETFNDRAQTFAL